MGLMRCRVGRFERRGGGKALDCVCLVEGFVLSDDV